MKKIFKLSFFFTILCLLICCIGCDKNNEGYITSFSDEGDIISMSGVYMDKDWDNDVLTYQDPVIPNQEVAIAVATQIFIGMFDGEPPENYAPQMVFYDEIDEIWIVSFWKDNSNDNTITVGGDYSIAMQKSDGKVLRIWLGE